MAPSTKSNIPDVPPMICDQAKQKYYTTGEFLGKGGFAACYKVTNLSGEIYAAKIVSKQFVKQKNAEKATQLQQEIKIHKSMTHENIVKLFFAFEDNANIYIFLELCNRRSMMELQRRRKAITEPEVRYWTQQVTSACVYIHSLHIIHRDLKLGNLFITDDMVLKVGDFGLATYSLDGKGDKRWLCGTPNYIAPEVLQKKQHSTKVDIWAIGCIVYVLLVGKPPFETSSLDLTYRKITRNEYDIPEELDKEAAALIKRLLAAEPTDRPDAYEILKTPFMQAFTPRRLPVSCLTTKPVFTTIPDAMNAATTQPTQLRCNVLAERTATSETYLAELDQQISEILNKKLVEKPLTDDLLKDPASIPIYWVSKWVDYSLRYAFAYQLCDGSLGASYKDGSKLIMDASKEYCQYRSSKNEEAFFSVLTCPLAYEKKLILLQNFENYMTLNLKKAGSNVLRDGVEIGRLPVLQHWIRTKTTVSFLLSNGTYQCNFNNDHSKVIICPLMGAATLIDSNQTFHTYKLSNLDHSKVIICPLMGAATLIDANQTFHTYKLSNLVANGAPRELTDRLHYTLNYIRKLQEINW
uniref:Serine/threonine-protein kinase PLK n=1 Tax=Panagrolaimus sp. ES5 TaxID=591445 RepID=A0AC34FUC5_9BILA